MKTVRVRVFVSVDAGGDWAAAGCFLMTEDRALAETNHNPKQHIGYWIEADLPLPNQAPEIVATVTRA